MDKFKRDLPSYVFALAIIIVVIATNPFTPNNRGLSLNSEKLSLTADYNKQPDISKLQSAEDYVQSSRVYSNDKRYHLAIDLLNKANKIFPENKKVFHELSSVYITRAFQVYQDDLNKIKGSEDYKNAIDLLKRNISLEPDSEEAYNNLINTFILVKDYNQALSNANQICSSKPDFKNTCSKVAEIYLLTGKKNNAIAYYQELAEKYPDNVWIYKKLGAIYNAQNRYSEAEKCFKNVYSKNPTPENLELLIQNYKEMSFMPNNKG